ncbi:hypothetical protein DFH06DRAFT_1135955 [Mycena polygramma]|nr:hypothetical protein DFH06DRAFT_1135955 [Mycena polygramma]
MTQGTEDFMKPTLQDLLKQWPLVSGQRTFVWESYNQCKRQQKESGGKAARLVLRTQQQSSWSLCQCCSDSFSNYKQKLNESPRSRPEDTTDFIETFDLSLGDLVAMNWVFAVLLGSFIYSLQEIYGDNRKMSELDKVLSHTAAKKTAAVSSCREVWPADRFWQGRSAPAKTVTSIADLLAALFHMFYSGRVHAKAAARDRALSTRRVCHLTLLISWNPRWFESYPSLDVYGAFQFQVRRPRGFNAQPRLLPDNNRSSSFDSPGLVYILSNGLANVERTLSERPGSTDDCQIRPSRSVFAGYKLKMY